MSMRYTLVMPPASLSQTLPSTSQCCGPTIDCCVSSLVNSGGRLHVLNVLVCLSNFAMPFWYIIESHKSPFGSVSRSSIPVGNPGLVTGTGYSVTLAVFGSSRPRNGSPKLENQAIPSASTMTSCGSMVFLGRSYSEMTTSVAAPVGRGSVLSGYGQVGPGLRLMLAR